MRRRKGFTLIEMLIVIAVIAVLVSVIIPTVGKSTLKARAAANAANLRSVQGAIQSERVLNKENFTETGVVYVAENENVGFGNYTTEAPNAKEVIVGDNVNVPDGTAMRVRLEEDVVIATYNGITAEQFAIIADTGEAEGIEISATDSMINTGTEIRNQSAELLNKLQTEGAEYEDDWRSVIAETILGITSNQDGPFSDENMAQLGGSDCKQCNNCNAFKAKRTDENVCSACGCSKYAHISIYANGAEGGLGYVEDLVDSYLETELVECWESKEFHCTDGVNNNGTCTKCGHSTWVYHDKSLSGFGKCRATVEQTRTDSAD